MFKRKNSCYFFERWNDTILPDSLVCTSACGLRVRSHRAKNFLLPTRVVCLPLSYRTRKQNHITIYLTNEIILLLSCLARNTVCHAASAKGSILSIIGTPFDVVDTLLWFAAACSIKGAEYIPLSKSKFRESRVEFCPPCFNQVALRQNSEVDFDILVIGWVNIMCDYLVESTCAQVMSENAHLELGNKACTWFGEICSCVLNYSRNKFHETTYKPYFRAL